MKSKLSLNELKIKSFITSVGEKDKVKSGVNTIFHACALTGELCQETDNSILCPPTTMEPPNNSRRCGTLITCDVNNNCGHQVSLGGEYNCP